ncbi:MAG: hypothetical protein ACI9SC_001673 [Gammaproteobacteria bacterium]|jgi:hypothetical protein
MNFDIDTAPPSLDILEQERNALVNDIKHLTTRDTIITFLIIIFGSVVLGLIVYWQTDNIRYAGISVAVFPVLGTVLSLMGVTKSTGFRSAANSISELHNKFVGLSAVSTASMDDVKTLCSRHKLVNEYHATLEQQGRVSVNAELAMFWDFDSSTVANTARGRDLVKNAKKTVSI